MLKNYLHILLLFSFIFITNSCTKVIDNSASDGDANLPVDRSAYIDIEPTWSPGGKWIAYVHDPPSDSTNLGPEGIYFIRPDGSGKKIWLSGSNYSTPDWSPDGKWIVFEKNGTIFKRTVTKDSLVQLTFDGANFFPSWSPDGNWIAFDSDRLDTYVAYYIWKMDKDGNNKSLVAFEPNNGATRMPTWGFDNKIYHIRYLKEVQGEEIFMMGEGGNHVKRLTNNEIRDLHPHFSSAVNKITYTSIHPPYHYPEIWVMDVDGSNKINLTSEREMIGDYSRWSPDGKKIIYTNIHQLNGRLWIMNKDGTNKKQLTH